LLYIRKRRQVMMRGAGAMIDGRGVSGICANEREGTVLQVMWWQVFRHLG
jgi:hypothetical protein